MFNAEKTLDPRQAHSMTCGGITRSVTGNDKDFIIGGWWLEGGG